MSAEFWNIQPEIDSAWLTQQHPPESPQTREEIRYKDKCYFVDRIYQTVTNWIRSIEAAERGESWKLETFLDSDMYVRHQPVDPSNSDLAWSNKVSGHTEGWGNGDWASQPAENDWGSSVQDGGWGTPEHDSVPQPSPSRRNRKKRPGRHRDFVEDIARQKSVNADRKRDMHSFYKASTDEKIRRIDELIRDLKHP